MAADRACRPAYRLCRAVALACTAIVCCALALFATTGSAHAQGGGTSYITPFPDNDSYRLEVWGDALAEGLLTGLIEQFADEPRVAVQRRHRPIPSLMRPTFDDDIGEIVSEIARNNAHIVVIQLGLNDRVPLRLPNGRRAAVGSEPWREEYGRRIDRIMRAFKAQRIVHLLAEHLQAAADPQQFAAVTQVTADGGHLFAQATGQPKFELFAKTPTEFFLKVVDARIVFSRSDDGKVSHLTLYQGGQEVPGRKVR